MTAFGANSQGGSEAVIDVPISTLRNALMAKDSLEIMKREREQLIALKSFYEKLEVKDSVLIASYDKLITSKNNEIASLEKQITNLTKQTEAFQLMTDQLNGIIKQKNRTIRKIVIGGVAISGFLTFLLVR